MLEEKVQYTHYSFSWQGYVGVYLLLFLFFFFFSFICLFVIKRTNTTKLGLRMGDEEKSLLKFGLMLL